MIKLTVLYNPPADPAAFDSHYFGVHVPLAQKIPGLERIEVSKVVGDAPYYLIAELWFASMDAFGAGMGTPEGQAVAADVANFGAAGSVTLISTIAD